MTFDPGSGQREAMKLEAWGAMRGTHVRHDEHHVLAALDDDVGSNSVRLVADVASRLFGVPVRAVHVVAGPGPRGTERAAAAAAVERGDADVLVGRPVDILAGLVDSPRAVLAVFGTGDVASRPSPRRPSGTAFAVARRVQRPILLVPASVARWAGPRRVLVALDGTGTTALLASGALASWPLGGTVTTTVHVSTEAGHDAGSLADLAASSSFDLLLLVWAQETGGPRTALVVELLATATMPVLLVPRAATAGQLRVTGVTAGEA
jgi:hypothetical protein